MGIRVLLADDHPVVLEGLEAILARRDGVEVIDRHRDGNTALEAIERESPDVAVLDVAMPGMTGIEVARVLRDRGSKVPIVILAGSVGSSDLVEALRLGVNGIVLKDEAAQVLGDCVESVSRGAQWLSTPLLDRALTIAEGGEDGPLAELTEREREVAAVVAEGLQNKEVADRLDIAAGTVRIHLQHIFQKLGVQNRVELANRIHGNGEKERQRSTSS